MSELKVKDVIEYLQELADSAQANYEDFMKHGREFDTSIGHSYAYLRDCLLRAITLINTRPEEKDDNELIEFYKFLSEMAIIDDESRGEGEAELSVKLYNKRKAEV